MSREWDKKTGCRYFDLDVLCAVNEEGEAFRSFVDRYGTYVFKRAEGFNARFQVCRYVSCDRSSRALLAECPRSEVYRCVGVTSEGCHVRRRCGAGGTGALAA